MGGLFKWAILWSPSAKMRAWTTWSPSHRNTLSMTWKPRSAILSYSTIGTVCLIFFFIPCIWQSKLLLWKSSSGRRSTWLFTHQNQSLVIYPTDWGVPEQEIHSFERCDSFVQCVSSMIWSIEDCNCTCTAYILNIQPILYLYRIYTKDKFFIIRKETGKMVERHEEIETCNRSLSLSIYCSLLLLTFEGQRVRTHPFFYSFTSTMFTTQNMNRDLIISFSMSVSVTDANWFGSLFIIYAPFGNL